MIRWWRNLDGARRTLTGLVGVILVMGALAWAAIPLYDLFCRVTGFGGTTRVAESESDLILDQTIQIRFDANTERGFPWEFRPLERTMPLRIGETGIAFYEAYNPTDQPIAGTASYNVTPYSTGSYFIKIACFCFTMQVLQPGERVQMPVTFYVDPEIVNDPDVIAGGLNTITLSYTFHPTEIPAGTPAAEVGTN
ncbi:cytochrome c oxidase assembly protein [Pararhodobacter aggregans]|uniref:cytochrome c oxidase assembly protein n=1 Tax=Pararhodobacter aggregans TaxID=404875 RepID=UPI003A95C679